LTGLETAASVITKQIGEQHPAWKPASSERRVRSLDGQFRFTDSSQSAYRCQHYRKACLIGSGFAIGLKSQNIQQGVKGGVSASEPWGRSGKSGEGWGYLRRQVNTDIPPLDHRREKDSTTNLVTNRVRASHRRSASDSELGSC
jgi:hypothetical protein